jgi:hypothetical protein
MILGFPGTRIGFLNQLLSTTLAEIRFFDSLEVISLIHREPAFWEAGDDGLAWRSGGMVGAIPLGISA